jgi:hypothetical protein
MTMQAVRRLGMAPEKSGLRLAWLLHAGKQNCWLVANLDFVGIAAAPHADRA